LCLTQTRLVVIGFEERARSASRHSSLCKTDELQYRQSILPKMRIDRPIAVAMQI
jgi:hypothetical protein